MKRFAKILLIAAMTAFLVFGPASCGKKGPPVARNILSCPQIP